MSKNVAVLIYTASMKSYRCSKCGRAIKKGEPYACFMKGGARCRSCGHAKLVKYCLCSDCEPSCVRYRDQMAQHRARRKTLSAAGQP